MSTTIELTHATALFTDRADGDLGRTAGLPTDDALENRGALIANLGLRCVRVAQQVHGASVLLAAPGDGYLVGPQEADGVASTDRETAVAVHVADCLPIAVAGEGAVAMLHAGWRGLAGGVIAEGVASLRRLGVSGPLEAAIGPGAGACCYETGSEVHAQFAGYGASRGSRLDLAAIASAQLRAAGVTLVSDLGICTLCAPPGMLFSHRRDGAQTGRQAGIAWLR